MRIVRITGLYEFYKYYSNPKSTTSSTNVFRGAPCISD
jgi:hypothetical protein